MEKFEIKKPENDESWKEKIHKIYQGETHLHSKASNRPGGAEDKNLHFDYRQLDFAEKLGHKFVVFSEHASNPGKPEVLDEDSELCRSILRQRESVSALNDSGKYKARAYSAVEASILFKDGEAVLDVPDDVSEKLDVVIASRHAIEDQEDLEKIKASLMAAIDNPEVDIIGHPYRYAAFHKHDWRFFRKNWAIRKRGCDPEEAGMMERINKDAEESRDKSVIRQIIGKEKPADSLAEDLHREFTGLYAAYWRNWDEIFEALEKKGKALEINLNNFEPTGEFYREFIARAAKHANLKFSIAFDFHNLKQLEKYKK
jgi:histidinol phosphatase-like PHP family hydrolase